MSFEDIRHKFNRLTFYTILFTFLGVTMTFIIFSSVAQVTLTCPTGQFVNQIGTTSDSCKSYFQSGPLQCQLLQITPNQEPSGCNGTITFPSAFSSIPTKYGISTNCLANTAQTLTGKTADQVCQALGIQLGHANSLIFTSQMSFQSDNGETWTSMPVAKTELYGTANHEVESWAVGATNGLFSVNCMTASVGASAVLRPEFADSASGRFFPVASIAGGLDISVNSFICGGGPGQVLFVNGPVNATIATQPPPTLFRVVGVGGNGVGDNPVFNNIILSLAIGVPLSIIPAVGCQFGGVVCVSTTTMKFWVTAISPSNAVGFLFPIFTWWACTC